MEFPGITAGGGFSGTSAESSSFRHGIFENTVKSIEIILGNGDVVEASDRVHSDLFFGAASACGTLGVITLLELNLIEAKTFVELTYHPVSSISDAVRLVETSSQNPNIDYIDSIFFGIDRGVLYRPRTKRDQPRDQTPAFHSAT
jgi:Delta24-sterol reductase